MYHAWRHAQRTFNNFPLCTCWWLFCYGAEKHWHITGNQPLDLHILHLFTSLCFHFEACGLPISLAAPCNNFTQFSLHLLDRNVNLNNNCGVINHWSLQSTSCEDASSIFVILYLSHTNCTYKYISSNKVIGNIPSSHLALAQKWVMVSMTPYQRIHSLLAYTYMHLLFPRLLFWQS